ncbi:MAG TPA: ABC transporter substrate-binding protein [Solirubrobacterales bacterium]|nr:ABC transporter substrate-binding protein [Solirubrobacterales bacterium]
MRRSALFVACTLLLLIPLATACGDDKAKDGDPRRVTLALDFQPNAVHAGIYTALARDLDGDHGIDLDVRVPTSSTDSLKLLAAGRADASIVDIHDLGLAAERGADLVGIAALVQRPLAAVIAQPHIRRPRDLENRRVGVTGLPSDDAVLRATVEADGGNYDAVRKITIGFSAVPSLASRKVDAVVTFWNAEGVALDHENIPTRQFRVDRYGAPRYPELVITTTRPNLADNPQLYRDLIGTLTAGTHAALANRPAAVREVAAASDSDPELVAAQLNAVAPALRPPLILDPITLRAWANFDTRFGILKDTPHVSKLFNTALIQP